MGFNIGINFSLNIYIYTYILCLNIFKLTTKFLLLYLVLVPIKSVNFNKSPYIY